MIWTAFAILSVFQGKVVFMAPTKPLVAQQIQACHKIMGIPQVRTLKLRPNHHFMNLSEEVDSHNWRFCAQSDMVQMTGNVAVNKRGDAWMSKRVFFLTPQV